MAYYYLGMHYFLLFFFKDEISLLPSSLNIFEKIFERTIDEELSFKARCLHFYVSLVFVIKIEGKLGDRIRFLTAFDYLCHIFDRHISSYHASDLFYSCTSLLNTYLILAYQNSLKIKKVINRYYPRYLHYKTRQLSMTDSQLDLFQKWLYDKLDNPSD